MASSYVTGGWDDLKVKWIFVAPLYIAFISFDLVNEGSPSAEADLQGALHLTTLIK